MSATHRELIPRAVHLLSDEQPWVGVKVIKNDKDCFDTSLAEIRVLSLIKQHNGGAHHLLRRA